MSIVALIPARGGSQRVPGKNLRLLGGRPLLAYAIVSAQKAGIFDAVYVSSNDNETLTVAQAYGADIIVRPDDISRPASTDLEWVRHALQELQHVAQFMIVRPTSPFRTAATLKRAWAEWIDAQHWDKPPSSMRAVQDVTEHPHKMWEVYGDRTKELVTKYWIEPFDQDWAECHYDKPTQKLPPVFVQNGCLQISSRDCLLDYGEHTGGRIVPFFTSGYEGHDINTEADWILAEALLERKLANLEWIP